MTACILVNLLFFVCLYFVVVVVLFFSMLLVRKIQWCIKALFVFIQEIEKRKKAEAAVKTAVINARKQAFIGGPDFEVITLY